MNKTVIGIALAVIVIAGGGWYVYSNKDSLMTQKPQLQQSLKELVAKGVSQKCTFSEPQSNTSGTIYIADGKVRGDFTSQTQSGAMSGHMISDGTTVNTWMDGMTQGFKSTFEMSPSSGTDTQQGLDPNKKTDYVCEKWSADKSKFEIPGNITFTDMSAMMQAGTTGAGNAGSMNPPSKSAQCNACDMAPEPQRTQCRQALQCR